MNIRVAFTVGVFVKLEWLVKFVTSHRWVCTWHVTNGHYYSAHICNLSQVCLKQSCHNLGVLKPFTSCWYVPTYVSFHSTVSVCCDTWTVTKEQSCQCLQWHIQIPWVAFTEDRVYWFFLTWVTVADSADACYGDDAQWVPVWCKHIRGAVPLTTLVMKVAATSVSLGVAHGFLCTQGRCWMQALATLTGVVVSLGNLVPEGGGAGWAVYQMSSVEEKEKYKQYSRSCHGELIAAL